MVGILHIIKIIIIITIKYRSSLKSALWLKYR